MPHSVTNSAAPTAAELSPPSLLQSDNALFLDVDGCLLELAQSPHEVIVPPGLPPLLMAIEDALDGAVAVITGRSLSTIDELLTPWQPSGAGIHGAELRRGTGPIVCAVGHSASVLAARLRDRFGSEPGVLIEDKGVAVALHFVLRPELAQSCEAFFCDAISSFDDLRLQRGRMVLEAVPLGVDKGSAIAAFMELAPFSGRMPVFAGDDLTDEAAFALFRQMPGIGIKVGPAPTLAKHRVASPVQVLEWLRLSLASLRGARSESAS